jgi:hypothetical protein
MPSSMVKIKTRSVLLQLGEVEDVEPVVVEAVLEAENLHLLLRIVMLPHKLHLVEEEEQGLNLKFQRSSQLKKEK